MKVIQRLTDYWKKSFLIFNMSKYKNSWEKIGRILVPNNKYYWSKSHMSLPTPLIFKDFVRIYFGSRDSKNRSRIGFLDYNPEKKK